MEHIFSFYVTSSFLNFEFLSSFENLGLLLKTHLHLCTVAQLPGHSVLSGFTVLQQWAGIAAVPAVVRRPEQSVQPKDEVQSWAVGEGVKQIHRVLCHRKESTEVSPRNTDRSTAL